MSTTSDRKLIESLESHAATINAHLDMLELALSNATAPRLRRKLESEIDYYIRELARVHAERDAAHRRLGG